MHEDSTLDQPHIMRYTKNTQAKQRQESKYRNIRQSIKQKNANIGQAEAKMSRFSRSTTLPHTFSMFVIQRSKVATMLSNHYSNTNTVPYATQLVYLSIESSSCPAFPTSIGRMIGFLRSSRVSFGDNCILVMGNWPRATPRFTNQLGGSG
jgi:hypothetical protein